MGREMSGRDVEQSHAAQAELDGYVKSAASSSRPAAEVDKAKQLLDDRAVEVSIAARREMPARG